MTARTNELCPNTSPQTCFGQVIYHLHQFVSFTGLLHSTHGSWMYSSSSLSIKVPIFTRIDRLGAGCCLTMAPGLISFWCRIGIKYNSCIVDFFNHSFSWLDKYVDQPIGQNGIKRTTKKIAGWPAFSSVKGFFHASDLGNNNCYEDPGSKLRSSCPSNLAEEISSGCLVLVEKLWVEHLPSPFSSAENHSRCRVDASLAIPLYLPGRQRVLACMESLQGACALNLQPTYLQPAHFIGNLRLAFPVPKCPFYNKNCRGL